MQSKIKIIAEAGNCHEGNIKTAFEMVDAAIDCGCDMIKFQAGKAEGFARKPEDIGFYKKFVMPLSAFIDIHSYSKSKGMECFFSIWSPEYEQLRKIEKYHKIPLRQLSEENVRKYDSPNTFFSVPRDFIKYNLKIRKGIPLYCIPEYPARYMSMNEFVHLKDRYNVIGLSDHFIGIHKAQIAIIMGATYIEKHFTLSHSFSNFRDHILSSNPTEMRELCQFSKEYQR